MNQLSAKKTLQWRLQYDHLLADDLTFLSYVVSMWDDIEDPKSMINGFRSFIHWKDRAEYWANDVLNDPNVVFLDIETTGFNPLEGDRICELAVVDSQGNTLFDSVINPEKECSREARAIHQITQYDLDKAEPLDSYRKELRKLLVSKRVVAYNAEFEEEFIFTELNIKPRIECAMKKLSEYCRIWDYHRGGFAWLKLPNALKSQSHRALIDVKNMIKVIEAMANEEKPDWLLDAIDRKRNQLDENRKCYG